MKFNPKKTSKFQTHFRDFYITFSHQKMQNLPIFLTINLKGYEILVVKFIEKFTDWSYQAALRPLQAQRPLLSFALRSSP